MIFFVIVLLLVIFSAAKAEGVNKFNGEYITRDATNNIKGIFVILILFSHAKSYLELGGIYDKPYLELQGHLNQMVVAMFLFYSGYGIMEQIKKREFSYIMSIPKKRFPNLLINFDISILLFALMWLCLGKPVTVKQLLIALVAWEGIGNSSWYIFVTFMLYIITFISFFFIKWFKKRWQQFIYLVVLTGLSVGLVLGLKYTHPKDPYWYNTAILYALGFWYSFFKDEIEKVIMKNDIIYFIAGAGLTGAYLFSYIHRWDSFYMFTIWGVLFTLGITLITMKVKIESNLLKWFGEHIFSIYILQRIPMIILKEYGVAGRHKYVFVILSIAVTCAMAVVFDYLTGKLSGLIWKNKKEIKQAS